MLTVLLFVCLFVNKVFLKKKSQIQLEKSLHGFTYQLDHGVLVDPSDRMHLCRDELVGAVELNVDAVAVDVDKAVDNGTVAHIREAAASVVNQSGQEDFPFGRHAFVLIRWTRERKEWKRNKS